MKSVQNNVFRPWTSDCTPIEKVKDTDHFKDKSTGHVKVKIEADTTEDGTNMINNMQAYFKSIIGSNSLKITLYAIIVAVPQQNCSEFQ